MAKAILIFSLALTLHSGIRAYSGPKCLGTFCIDRKTAVRKLFGQLGSPARKAEPFCCESRGRQASLYILTIDREQDVARQVMISDSSHCIAKARQSTTAHLHAWQTPDRM